MQIFSADAASGLGWYSPVYGRHEPATTIRVSHTGSAPVWLVSVFGFNPGNELVDVEMLPLWSEAGVLDQSVAVRMRRAESTDIFVVADERTSAHAVSASTSPKGLAPQSSVPMGERRADSTWRVGEVETDAHMLFYRADLGGDVSRVAMVDGSLVRSSARRKFVLTALREVPDLHVDLGPTHDDLLGGMHARLSGPAFGVKVEVGGLDLPIAVERRSLARPRSQVIR
jgi:hypothetical protein